MGIDMHEEARKIGQLTGEMSCTLQIVKKLKGMGFCFTVLETLIFNGVQIDKGFDERLDIFYRINLCIENSEDSINDTFIDCYYRNIDDLKKGMGNYIG